uniref:Putative conserved plasma membrane protein n=1 Tax=Culex tarsalis TaxID=7177 RepID=A0A1Q3FF17_CULTA
MSQFFIAQSLSKLRHTTHILSRQTISRCLATQSSKDKPSSPASEPKPVNDKPLQYFNSPASRWRAEHTRSGQDNQDMPWYQPYVVIASMAVFLLYFCVLREENDIDRSLEKSLYEHIPGLEEKQLVVSYHYNKENGLPTLEIEQRMKALGVEY